MTSRLAVVLLFTPILYTCFGCSRKSDVINVADSEANEASKYYKAAKGKLGCDLKTALFRIIRNHQTRNYGDLWQMIQTADLDKYYEGDNTILDRYSENPSGSDFFEYSKKVDQCGKSRKEGDCYNREHSIPKSWFSKQKPMLTDGHHIFASDGYVNSRRSNYPYGEVQRATYTSQSGSMLGPGKSQLGYSGKVFEPIDEFKGDFARAYFYMATCYEDQIFKWKNNDRIANDVLDGTKCTVFVPWVLSTLKRWHKIDPVSRTDIYRNEEVFRFQGNRNPFVDHPEYVEAIWGN